MKKSDFRVALEQAKQSVACARKLNFDKGETEALLQTGQCYTRLLARDSARSDLTAALTLAREKKFRKLEVDALNFLGDVYYFNYSGSRFFAKEQETTEALTQLNEARMLAEEIGYREGMGYADLAMARIYRSVKNFETAVHLSRRALENCDAAQRPSALAHVGYTFHEWHKFDSASWLTDSSVYWLKKAIELSVETNVERGKIAGIYPALSGEYLRGNQPDSAFKYAQSYVAYAQQANSGSAEGWSYAILADAYAARRNYDQAAYYYEKAISFRVNEKDYIGLSMHQLNYGKAMVHAGQNTKAEKLLEQAVESGRLANDWVRYSEALLAIIQLHTDKKQWDKASSYQKLYIALSDSIANSRFAEAHTQLANAVRDKQVQRLEEKNENAQREIEEQKLYRTFLIILVFVAILIILLIYRLLRLKRNSVIALSEQNAIIAAQAEELKASLESLKEISGKLFQSEKMASLGLLTAGVAHEINNPLNYISGGVQGLDITLRSLLDKLAQENPHSRESLAEAKGEVAMLVSAIMKGVERTCKTVNSLKVFSRREDSGMERVSVKECLDLALTILSFKIKDTRARVEYNESPDFYVLGNASQLVQVFINVIDNALYAMENVSHERVVYVDQALDTNWVVVSIKDSGTGIPESYRHKVFDPFFSLKPIGKGTGLGLSISHGIIEGHGGKLTFESEEGKGTTFKVYLKHTK